MLVLAANYLQRDIYFIGQPLENHLPWHCCVYRPSSMSKANQVIETGDQILLTVSDCVELIASAKIEDPLHFPLILRFTDRQYSAYVHCTRTIPGYTGVSAGDSSGEDMNISQDDLSDEEMKGDDDSSAGCSVPQLGSAGGGHRELSTRLAAAEITHTLRRAIQLILRCSASSHYPALLEFLVNTVAVSSAAAQLRFGATDLVQLSPADIRLIQLEFHIPDTVMIQWHSWAAERAYHSNDLIGAPDSRLSQGTGPGSVPCASVSAESSGSSAPPLSLPATPF